MANILDLRSKVLEYYHKVPKQSQFHLDEISTLLNNMVAEYHHLEDLLTIAEDEFNKSNESYESLKWEFADLQKENEKLNKKLNSGLSVK